MDGSSVPLTAEDIHNLVKSWDRAAWPTFLEWQEPFLVRDARPDSPTYGKKISLGPDWLVDKQPISDEVAAALFRDSGMRWLAKHNWTVGMQMFVSEGTMDTATGGWRIDFGMDRTEFEGDDLLHAISKAINHITESEKKKEGQ